MTPTEFTLLLLTGLFQLVSMVVLWNHIPAIDALLVQLLGETVRMRQWSRRFGAR